MAFSKVTTSLEQNRNSLRELSDEELEVDEKLEDESLSFDALESESKQISDSSNTCSSISEYRRRPIWNRTVWKPESSFWRRDSRGIGATSMRDLVRWLLVLEKYVISGRYLAGGKYIFGTGMAMPRKEMADLSEKFHRSLNSNFSQLCALKFGQ
jgi:hypothetical protein